jgi:hypothetical protein
MKEQPGEATTGEPSNTAAANADIITEADTTVASAAEPATADVVPVYSLTDPDTRQHILEQGYRENRSLTYMWQNDLAALLGVPYPMGNNFITIEIREDIVPRLKAFGMALTQFKFNNLVMKSVVDHLYDCDVHTFFPMIKNIESVIRMEQNKH